jgi:hypothetical protein
MSQAIKRNDLEDALALFPQIFLIEDIILSSRQEIIHDHPLIATLQANPHLLASTHVNQSLTNSFLAQNLASGPLLQALANDLAITRQARPITLKLASHQLCQLPKSQVTDYQHV